MKVMSLERRTLKMVGIISSEGKPYYWRMAISRFICLTTPILFLPPLIVYLVRNFRDVSEATNVFYLICVALMISMTYSELWFKRDVILSIIDGIQELVNHSFTSYKPEYEKTESLCYKVFHYFQVFVFCSIFGVVSVPLCIYLFVCIFGEDPNDVRLLPAAMILPLDVNEWSGYILGYFLCYLAAYLFSTVASLYAMYVSIALYLKAAFNEVRFKLETINQNLENFHHYSIASSYDCDTLHDLVSSLKSHLRVLELLDELKLFFERNKYYIMSFGALCLCTGLFQIQQSALNGSQMIFQLVAACSCDTAVMFMLCFSGEIIIDAHDISDDVYNLYWYLFDAKSKHIVRLMIARTQKPYYFASYKGINCSLETFINIIRKAGAALAMLQSI